MNRPRLLVAFCCQGGEAMGYHLAGFDVEGVDIAPQPRFPFTFHLGDAVQFVQEHGHRFDAIAGGPPCQRYSATQRIQRNDHPDLIGPFRDAVRATGLPYVIENVEPARPLLIDPIMLCGYTFGLHTDRHRLFETGGFTLPQPEHPAHPGIKVKMGRPLRDGDYYHAVGNFSNVPYVRQDMGVPWMSRDGIRECIPPAYTHWIGERWLAQL